MAYSHIFVYDNYVFIMYVQMCGGPTPFLNSFSVFLSPIAPPLCVCVCTYVYDPMHMCVVYRARCRVLSSIALWLIPLR